ncbi:unnamed protein product, partial [Ectocarpus sp. 12 AP-2014]
KSAPSRSKKQEGTESSIPEGKPTKVGEEGSKAKSSSSRKKERSSSISDGSKKKQTDQAEEERVCDAGSKSESKPKPAEKKKDRVRRSINGPNDASGEDPNGLEGQEGEASAKKSKHSDSKKGHRHSKHEPEHHTSDSGGREANEIRPLSTVGSGDQGSREDKTERRGSKAKKEDKRDREKQGGRRSSASRKSKSSASSKPTMEPVEGPSAGDGTTYTAPGGDASGSGSTIEGVGTGGLKSVESTAVAAPKAEGASGSVDSLVTREAERTAVAPEPSVAEGSGGNGGAGTALKKEDVLGGVEQSSLATATDTG